MSSNFADLTRDQLAKLVPELLLIGQLIDRSGMAWCVQAFGRDEMARIAIDEWAASSPIYTRRIQRALGFEGDDVVTIFKGLQLDIGAPPQFMDFRFTVEDRWTGAFTLAHCGALMDVEPLGDDYVRAMCHDIEDPTFDATAVATNPRAQVRPIHRPPRPPERRKPHCAWTVRIRDDHPEAAAHPGLDEIGRTHAAQVELDAIWPQGPGLTAYDGPLMDDLDLAAFSHSALVRIADEVCLQMHLLVLAFRRAVRLRDAEREPEITTKQLIGIAGVAAKRLAGLGCPVEDVLRLHPLVNPIAYVGSAWPTIAAGAAHADGAWISLVGPDEIRPLQAIVQALDLWLDVEVTGSGGKWTATIVPRTEPAEPMGEVAVTEFSSGAAWEFAPRRSLPIWPV